MSYDVSVTIEAYDDMSNIAQYIFDEFSYDEAVDFKQKIDNRFDDIGYNPKTNIHTEFMYRGWLIYRAILSPSLIFYIIDEDNCTVYILRVLRGESNWEEKLRNRGIYHDVDGNII